MARKFEALGGFRFQPCRGFIVFIVSIRSEAREPEESGQRPPGRKKKEGRGKTWLSGKKAHQSLFLANSF